MPALPQSTAINAELERIVGRDNTMAIAAAAKARAELSWTSLPARPPGPWYAMLPKPAANVSAPSTFQRARPSVRPRRHTQTPTAQYAALETKLAGWAMSPSRIRSQSDPAIWFERSASDTAVG